METYLLNKGIAVQCRAVTKTFGAGKNKVEALRGVDLDVYDGELLMLVGPSGSGKTTLISVVAGILDHNDGECLLYGQEHSRMSKRDRVMRGGSQVSV